MNTLDGVDLWGRLGRAIQGLEFRDFQFGVIDSDDNDIDITPPPPAAACVDALLGQIKYARSIDQFRIHLLPGNQVPMFDLKEFVTSNKNLLEVSILMTV